MTPKVLLVDDEVEFATALAKVLRRRGLAVGVAAGGEAALAALRDHPFPVVVLDVKMPGLDGLAALREIRAGWPETRVIVMTGHLSPGEEETTLAQGAFAYLLKPYPTEKLMAVIDDALGRKP